MSLLKVVICRGYIDLESAILGSILIKILLCDFTFLGHKISHFGQDVQFFFACTVWKQQSLGQTLTRTSYNVALFQQWLYSFSLRPDLWTVQLIVILSAISPKIGRRFQQIICHSYIRLSVNALYAI